MKEENRQEKKDPFIVHQENYLIDFLPVYEQLGFTPKRIFQTQVKLPFHIPIENGTCLTMAVTEDYAVTMIINSISISQGYGPGLLTEDSYQLKIERSLVELLLVTKDDFPIPEKEGENLPSYLFDQCLDVLNKLVKSYLITTKDISIHQVTTRMFEVMAMWKTIQTSDWVSESGLLMLHHDIPYEKPILKQDEYEKIVWYANVINQEWNPFIFPEELLLNAKRNLLKGFFRESVMYAQTSFETFIKTLLVEIYKLDGLPLEELENKFELEGFMRVLKTECHPKIGGNWNIQNETDPLMKWYRNCYRIRNKVVHSGYSPDYKEAVEAIASSEYGRGHVLELLKRKKKKYPKIFEYIIMKYA